MNQFRSRRVTRILIKFLSTLQDAVQRHKFQTARCYCCSAPATVIVKRFVNNQVSDGLFAEPEIRAANWSVSRLLFAKYLCRYEDLDYAPITREMPFLTNVLFTTYETIYRLQTDLEDFEEFRIALWATSAKTNTLRTSRKQYFFITNASKLIFPVLSRKIGWKCMCNNAISAYEL